MQQVFLWVSQAIYALQLVLNFTECKHNNNINHIVTSCLNSDVLDNCRYAAMGLAVLGENWKCEPVTHYIYILAALYCS